MLIVTRLEKIHSQINRHFGIEQWQIYLKHVVVSSLENIKPQVDLKKEKSQNPFPHA